MTTEMAPLSLAERSKQIEAAYGELVRDHERMAGDFDVASLTAEESQFASSQVGMMWRRFRRNRAAMVGGTIVILYYVVALLGNFIAPYGLSERFIDKIYLPPQPIFLFDDGQFKPFVYSVTTEYDSNLNRIYMRTEEKLPLKFFVRGAEYEFLGLIESDLHLFGTDEGGIVSLLGTDRQGRDMFSRAILGSQVSLTIGLIGVSISLFIGTVLGVASGYYGGWIDEAIQRLIEIVRAFPSIPLWMALSAALPVGWPPLQTYFAVTVILSLIGWTWLARQLRGMVLSLRQTDYIMAAKLVGASDVRIIFRHLIPASLGQIIVVATLALPAMILAETSLSFLGLGLRPPITSWGVLLKEAQNIQSLAIYPWVLWPAAFIVGVILAFSFLGDGLRDAADPYSV